MGSSSYRPTRGESDRSFYPVLHSFHVLFVFFSLVYMSFSLAFNFLTVDRPASHLLFASEPFDGLILCQRFSLSPVTAEIKMLRLPGLISSIIVIPSMFSDPTRHSFLIWHIYSRSRHLPIEFRFRNFVLFSLLILAGDVEVNPGPVTISSNLNFVHLNSRSATSISDSFNKPVLINELISDKSIDILALTETWLSPDTLPSVLNSLTPKGYFILHQPRVQGRGGGIALIYRQSLNISKVDIPSFPSFEAFCLNLSLANFSCTILTVYRSPSHSKSTFLTEFSTLLESLISSPSELLITGDFNFHVDCPSDPNVSQLLSLFQTFDLTQFVSFPTHSSGHTLDLFITRSTSDLIADVDFSIQPFSDHYSIHSVLSVPSTGRLPRTSKLIRSIRSIDPVAFSNDVFDSFLYSRPPTTLDSYEALFSSTMSTLLEKHAPLKTITCSSRTRKPFITDEIRAAKTKRSKLETTFRRLKTEENKTKYKIQSRIVAKLVTNSRRTYYRTLIANNSKTPKKLWPVLNSLLTRTLPPTLPTYSSAQDLAKSFLDFFEDKITKLSSSFSAVPLSFAHSLPRSPPLPLSVFQPATEAEVKRIILASSNSTCILDSIPTSLIKSCIDAFLPPITTLINLSLHEGKFPTNFKKAIVKPLLKKHSLPREDLASYRPISNLNFISKVLERIIHNRLTTHLHSFPSICPFQSAYRKFHSTETALLRIHNDLTLAINQQKVSALVLLDLSAAFDTIDHHILLTRLNSIFGISGPALSLLSSYLLDRSQFVSIDSQSSSESKLYTGVPQGSVLGPLLFTLYTTPLSYLFDNKPIGFHFYADDTQLYISFSSIDSASSLSLLSSTLDSVYDWLHSNRLTVNPSKTEYLLIGNVQQQRKIISSSITFCNSIISPTESARNLGIVLDSNLSFHKQISSVCKNSFYQIRQIRQIRSSLDLNSTIILANSLVSSKLDYCNSLYYGLPQSSLSRLQCVQNSLARVVFPSVRRTDHITPVLRRLHWLPISQRITFKLALLTFKALSHKEPSYLFELLTPHKPTRNLRSSNQHLLTIPDIRSAVGRHSFSFSAPSVWNSLPLDLRLCSSLSQFRSQLKTHLFPP